MILPIRGIWNTNQTKQKQTDTEHKINGCQRGSGLGVDAMKGISSKVMDGSLTRAVDHFVVYVDAEL